MATNKQIMADYLLKSPANGEDHQLEGSFLTSVMDKSTTLASLKCRTLPQGHMLCS
jgi:hypothetical protein